MTTTTRPTRPAWLAADLIDEDLVQRIHEHADRVVPMIERLAEWTAAARVLIAEHNAAGLPWLDSNDRCLERWDGTGRLDAIAVLLERLSEFFDADLHATSCEGNYSSAQALAEMRGDWTAADAERHAVMMSGAGQ